MRKIYENSKYFLFAFLIAFLSVVFNSNVFAGETNSKFVKILYFRVFMDKGLFIRDH